MRKLAVAWIDRASRLAVILVPLFAMHARAGVEFVIALVDAGFLIRCVLTGEWAWLRAGWVIAGAFWWLWLMVCSLPAIGIGGTAALVQAVVIVRFLLFVAALERTVLASAAARRWLQGALVATAVYIGGQSLLQFATGRNLWGYPRSPFGELTGPFLLARAGAPLSRLIFPTMLPALAHLLQAGTAGRLAAVALAVLAVGTQVLIGQRMPLLLVVFGLAIAALLLRPLRPALLAGVLGGGLLIAATAALAPPTFYRLVTKFSAQMEAFPQSDYGLIAARAVFIAEAHPLFGQGFDGFRNACPNPTYWHGWSATPDTPDGGGMRICSIHPHNHYLEAVTNAGLPGLVLFSALILLWLRDLGRGLWRHPDPLRVGLFVAALIQEWPIASASGFTGLEIASFFFLLLGYGLALARDAART